MATDQLAIDSQYPSAKTKEEITLKQIEEQKSFVRRYVAF